MPLYWTIDSRLQLLIEVADGDVSKADVEAYLAIVNGSPNIPEWRKLFDARFGRLDFSAEVPPGHSGAWPPSRSPARRFDATSVTLTIFA